MSLGRLVLIHTLTNLYLKIGDIEIKGQGHWAHQRKLVSVQYLQTNLYLRVGDIDIKGQGHGAQKIGFCEISP